MNTRIVQLGNDETRDEPVANTPYFGKSWKLLGKRVRKYLNDNDTGGISLNVMNDGEIVATYVIDHEQDEN